jgi:TatD DNase family protein
MRYFDAHTHAQFSAFSGDYREVIRRALDASVGLINIGTQRDTSRRAVEIAHEFENEPVYATVGLHPIHTSKSYHDEQELGLSQTDADDTQTDAESQRGSAPARQSLGAGGSSQRKSAPAGFTSRGEEFDFEYYQKLAHDPKVVAIGECGLEYYRLERTEDGGWRKEDSEKIEKQKKAFVAQIELAKAVGKPLMVHCRPAEAGRASPQNEAGRDAYDDLLEILKANSSKLKADSPGIIHFFAGTKDEARAFLDLGFSFTFGGVITFPPRKGKTGGDYDEIIRYLPADRILSETDAPYVAPAPYRGKRNEPLFVIEVTKKLAEIKGLTVEAMAEQILENAKRIFGLTL